MAKMIESMEQLLRGDAPRASLWDIAGAAVVLLEAGAFLLNLTRWWKASHASKQPQLSTGIHRILTIAYFESVSVLWTAVDRCGLIIERRLDLSLII
jgi:hypothetical protein